MNNRITFIHLTFAQCLLAGMSFLFASTAYSQTCAGQSITHQFESGARWQMCWHIDDRAGLTLSDVAYGPPQEAVRTVLKSASVAQILLKYDEDRVATHVLTESGLGSLNHVSANALSCVNGTVHSGSNGAAVCVKVKNKNSMTSLRRSVSKRRHELSLYANSEVGVQSFEQVWRFSEDGEITPALRFGGELERFTQQAQYGSVINRAGLLAANASLLYTWRLDFSIANTPHNDLVEQIEFIPHETNVVRRSIDTRLLEVESLHKVNRDRFRGWLIKDADIFAGSSGITRIGYYLDPQVSGFDFVNRTNNWANFDLAVTRQRDCEWLASGNVLEDTDCADNLDEFVNGEPLSGEDVALWFSLARGFVPKAEDYPAISTREASFKLIPFDWSASTPFTALEE